ncbi:anhydro-N-acetylmuramic acid kinase [Sphingobacteriaceae bacterium]|nr:anhydro-N-acetylmuramic acid kinase [Sphingobacteriaceae bacterium]
MLVLGLMSGTSLDGLDLALCELEQQSGKYSYKIISAKTVAYSNDWKTRLLEAKNASAESYFALHAAYGKYMAGEVNSFLKETNLKPDLIASHGHTVFHQPSLGFSTQLGCGATIAANAKITTVCDFRSLDVALGGQGAPLVPIGDKQLFSDYDACLNIGGIANISYDDVSGNRVAYDICEANMLLNLLAERAGKAYDENGELARSGKVNDSLLNTLNTFEYYNQRGAKSIGREWFEKNVELLLEDKTGTQDLLATSTEHIADIISNELNRLKLKNVLITGGGAFNSYLIERIKSKTQCDLVLPSDEVINFKEALIFAFLGYLRVSQKTNTLHTVTGASQTSGGGAIYSI